MLCYMQPCISPRKAAILTSQWPLFASPPAMPPKKCLFKTYACHEEEEMVVVEEEQLEAPVKKKPTRRGGKTKNQGAKNDRAEPVGPEEQQQAGRLQGITGHEPRQPLEPPSRWEESEQDNWQQESWNQWAQQQKDQWQDDQEERWNVGDKRGSSSSAEQAQQTYSQPKGSASAKRWRLPQDKAPPAVPFRE